jgi:hypothetical protein
MKRQNRPSDADRNSGLDDACFCANRRRSARPSRGGSIFCTATTREDYCRRPATRPFGRGPGLHSIPSLNLRIVPVFGPNALNVPPRIGHMDVPGGGATSREGHQFIPLKLTSNSLKAVQNLTDIYRQVYLLRDIEKLNLKQTADALNISVGSVKV